MIAIIDTVIVSQYSKGVIFFPGGLIRISIKIVSWLKSQEKMKLKGQKGCKAILMFIHVILIFARNSWTCEDSNNSNQEININMFPQLS